MIERELRMAGVGVVDQQPLLVMANEIGVTFNADLVALDTGDIGSVYINPDADSAAVDVLRSTATITLPGTSKTYPDTTYMASAGVPSNAETISYWLSHDSTSIVQQRIHPVPARERAPGCASSRAASSTTGRHDLPLLQDRHAWAI